jgi:hypothetical protein
MAQSPYYVSRPDNRKVLMGVVLRTVLIFALMGAWGWRQWRAGFDVGAAMMQCVDTVAIIGAEEGLQSPACKETKKNEWRVKWRV